MKKWKTMLVVVIENFFVSIIGALIGILMVAPVAYYFYVSPIQLKGEYAEIYENFGFDPVIPFSINPEIAIDHASIIVLISMVLTIYPIMVIRKLKPVESMKL